MLKERFTISASSLGNYFGVGFVDPMTQLEIDLGEREPDFDDNAKFRMLLGTKLEDGMLDYFEEALGISITDRNVEVLEGFEGRMRYKVDGKSIYEGEPIIVENKVSKTEFTESLGYIMQCNAYMHCEGYKKALLCGLSKGDPTYKWIYYDAELVEDIKEMVEAVHSILNGLAEKDQFPWHLVEKYGKEQAILEEVNAEELDKDDLALIEELYLLKKEISTLTKREKELKTYLEGAFENKILTTEAFTFSVKPYTREGGYDMVRLAIEHPEIDLKQYKNPSSVSKTLRYTKGKSEV